MKNLQRIRKEKGLSQAKLAELSGIKVRMIQNYEQGVNDINGMASLTLYHLAKALDVKMEELLEL